MAPGNYANPEFMKYTLLIAGLLFSVSSIPAQNYSYSTQPGAGGIQEGIAVYYADYMHGRRTALGEVYRMEEFTAAHKTLAKGTLVKVTRLDNGQSVVVRINDRGPFDPGVSIDLSKAAAMKIGLVKKGRARVRLETVGYSNTNPENGLMPGEKPNPYESSSYTTRGTTNPYGNNQPSGYNYMATPKPAAPSSYGYSNMVTNAGVEPYPALPPGASGYAIQLASYSKLENARNQLRQLEQHGMQNLYIWHKDGMHKLVIAAFSGKSSAAAYLERLKREHLQDGLVVKIK